MRRSFQYNFSGKRHVIVEFDIVKKNGNKAIAENITFTGNFRHYFRQNVTIDIIGKRHEYAFYKDNVWEGGGDFEQMIKRILTILEEYD